MDNARKREMDSIYSTISLEKIPWNIETPPVVLVDLVESGTILPCKAIDLGCGVGNYIIYLARKGFDAVGVDISSVAINHAAMNADRLGVACRFMVADLLGDIRNIRDRFDFAYDWEVMHHIFPEHRRVYVNNVHRLLNPHGKYLSVCFSEDNPQFGGTGKYRQTPLGTRLYFSSELEMRNLFAPLFNIIELRTIEIAGKFAPHRAICALLEKRG